MEICLCLTPLLLLLPVRGVGGLYLLLGLVPLTRLFQHPFLRYIDHCIPKQEECSMV
jgi:hypothetical protein